MLGGLRAASIIGAVKNASTQSVRVLHLLACDDWGGTEVQVSEQAIRSLGRPCVQHVAILAPQGPVFDRLARAGVSVRTLSGSGGHLGTAIRLRTLIRRGRYDVIEAYGIRCALVARAAAGRARILVGVRGLHVVNTVRPETDRRVRVSEALLRMLSPVVAGFSVNAEGTRSNLVKLGIPPSKIVVTLNGVESKVPQARPGTGGPMTLTCVARFVPFKNHRCLVDATRAAVDDGNDVRLRLVGHGQLFQEVVERAVTLGSRFETTGRLEREEVAEHLARSHAFALISFPAEGLPGSMIEAMAAGLPVIGTDIPGIRELIDDGVNGFIVPVDDVDATRNAIARLAADPAGRARMGAAGRHRAVERHSWGALTRRKEAIYAVVALRRPLSDVN
jgi:glycosyltransferase involved in cell wall biosynthesis